MPAPRRISRDSILDASIRIVDADGLAALTMRRVASELSVESPSLYRHVKNKDALLDGVVDRILGEIKPPEVEGAWPDRVSGFMAAARQVLLSHPNAVALVASRYLVEVDSVDKVEDALREIADIGLSAELSDRILTVLVAFLFGHAIRQVRTGSERASEQRQAAMALRASLDAERFPLYVQTSGTKLPNYDAEFELGVEMLIYGLTKVVLDSLEAQPLKTVGPVA